MSSLTLINIFEIIFASLLLIILFPLILILFILLFISQGKPVIFISKRVGKNGHEFNIYKFRTMENKIKHNDPDKITFIGKFLRKLSIDELLQIINVIKGDMSFVGPRPLLEEYLDYYSAEEFESHNVKPGITGYAQINGRNSISWEKKFKYDLWYIKNLSFANDIKIIFITIKKVIQRTNINQSENISMPKFKGSMKKK